MNEMHYHAPVQINNICKPVCIFKAFLFSEQLIVYAQVKWKGNVHLKRFKATKTLSYVRQGKLAYLCIYQVTMQFSGVFYQ